jgi:uncharacterized damage-inducible protein DinB
MLLDLINYTQLADRRVIDIFLQAETALPEAQNMFSHILNSQRIWLDRVQGSEPQYDRYQLQPVDLFDEMHNQNCKDMLEIVHNHDLKEIIIYKNSSGEAFSNAVHDILFHVVNHSTYHRAQVATQFRLNNIQPPVTDYISYKREGLI